MDRAILASITTNQRLEKLGQIRTDVRSDLGTIKEYLYFIAQELVLQNYEARQNNMVQRLNRSRNL